MRCESLGGPQFETHCETRRMKIASALDTRLHTGAGGHHRQPPREVAEPGDERRNTALTAPPQREHPAPSPPAERCVTSGACRLATLAHPNLRV